MVAAAAIAALAAGSVGLVVAAGALIAARAFARAAVRYRLLAAAFALVALIGPAALAAAALRPARSGAGTGNGALGAVAVPLLTAAAALGAALLFELVLDVARLRRIKRAARPLGAVAVRRARIATSPAVPTPTAIGYLHPAIIVPSGFRGRVDEAEWEAVVAHECAHLDRRDDWAKALQSAVLRIGWWLPGLWILSRALDLERELASDERAADTAAGARRYAACLLRLATDGCADAVAPALWGRRSHVAIRVERLLQPPAEGSALLRATALGAFTATALAAIGVAFALTPPIGRLAVGPAVHRHPLMAAHPQKRALHRAVGIIRRLPVATPAPVVVAYVVRPLPLRVRAHPAPIVVQAPRATERRVPARPKVLAATPVQRPHVAPAKADPAAPVVSYVPPRVHCATCFGPLHAPDVSFAPTATAPAAPFTGSTTLASEETGSGPASTAPGILWLRLPRAVAVP